MDNYILDGQYGKYLGQNGIRVGEALRKAGVAEDLFSRKRPTLSEADYYRFMDAVGEQLFAAGFRFLLQQKRPYLHQAAEPV